MLKYFIFCVFISSLSGQALSEESEEVDVDFGNSPFNDTDGNIVPLPRYAQLNINDKTYTIIYQPLNWHAAMELCNSQNQNIASVTNDDENKKLIDTLIQNELLYSDSSFWLGATDLSHYGQYSWITNGRPVRYTNWRSGEPNNAGGNEHCVELLSNGQWNDTPCEEKRRVICQSKPTCINYVTPYYA